MPDCCRQPRWLLCHWLASALACWQLPALFSFMGREEPYLAPAVTYMAIILVGSALFSLAMASNSVLSAMAAYGIALRIEHLILLPVTGINIAALSLTGVNYGAMLYVRVRETL